MVSMMRRVRWGLSPMLHTSEGEGKEVQRGRLAGYKGLVAWAERREGRSEKEEDLREEIAALAEGSRGQRRREEGGGAESE